MESLSILKAKTRVDYKATLLSVPVGETWMIKANGRTSNGLAVAASRLRRQGHVFYLETNDSGMLLITRKS